MQFLLDRTYLSACTRTRLPQRIIQKDIHPIMRATTRDHNRGGQPQPPAPSLPSLISVPPTSTQWRCHQNFTCANIASSAEAAAAAAAAAKFRAEASYEAKKMRSYMLKMLKEMKMCASAGEASRQEGKACHLRILSLHSRAAASGCNNKPQSLSFMYKFESQLKYAE